MMRAPLEPSIDELDPEKERSLAVPLFLSSLIGVGYLYLTTTLAGTPLPSSAWTWVALGLICELAAPATEGMGFVPWAYPIYVSLLTLPGGPGRAAALVPVVTLTIRTLTRGSESLGRRLIEFSSDLLCLLALVGFLKLIPIPADNRIPGNLSQMWPWLIPLGSYWLTWTAAPFLFQNTILGSIHRDWTLARERVHPTLLFLTLFGLTSSVLTMAGGNASSLWSSAGPVLLLAIVPAGRAQAKLWSIEADQLRGRTARRLLEKDQQKIEQEQLRTLELSKKTQQEEMRVQNQRALFESVGNLFEEVTKAWGQGYSRQFLGTIRQRIPCQTMILFARRSRLNRWERVSAHGRQTDRFDVLLGSLDSSLVGEALRTQACKLLRPNDPLSLDRNDAELAIPIDRWGVFYVSDPDPKLLEKHQELLQALAPHLRVYVDAANFYESQKEALESEAALRKRTEEIARRLAAVLKSLATLVGENDPETLLEESLAQISQLVPCRAVSITWSPSENQQFRRNLPQREAVWSQMAYNLETWQSQENPNWSRQTGRFEEQDCHWWPVAMLNGTVSLIEEPSTPLEEIDLEVLRLFVWQAERLLENATLYKELQQTHEDLQLSQSQLIQSSKLAAIGQLAAGVAHELNTPLGAISVAIDGALMVLTTKPDRSKQRLEKALLSIEQMQQIISKLLFYSRESRSGRQEIDLKVVVEASLQLVGHLLHLDNVEVQFYPGPPCKVEANPNELQQVFTNLVLNAKDACLSPGASGRVISVRTFKEGPVATVEVSDSGCGMDPATKERIFEPFFTTKQVGQGTGLGLSTSLLIVQEHQGTLEVQSELGRGTTFRVKLPLYSPISAM